MEAWKTRVYATYAATAAEAAGYPPGDRRKRARDVRDYRRRYRAFLPADRSSPVLDIGCGSGAFIEMLRRLGYTAVEGIDFSDTQVATAAAHGVAGVRAASAVQYLSERRQRYAVITAFSVLEHQTRAELFELLDAVRDALLPGGLFMAVVPNAKGLFGAHVRFADITHELSFTPASVVQTCRVAQLDVVAIAEHGPIVHGGVSAIRWAVWQAIRAGLLIARAAEGGDIRWPVFTQDLVFVARRATGQPSPRQS
jgi:SAM-dependent methyltransferase